MTSSVFNFYTDYTRPPTCFSLCWMTSPQTPLPPPRTLPVSPCAGWPRGNPPSLVPYLFLPVLDDLEGPPPPVPYLFLPVLDDLEGPPPPVPYLFLPVLDDLEGPPPGTLPVSPCAGWPRGTRPPVPYLFLPVLDDLEGPSPRYPTCFSLCWMTSRDPPPPVPYLFLPVLDDLEGPPPGTLPVSPCAGWPRGTPPSRYPTCFSLCWMTLRDPPPPVPYLFLPVLDDLEGPPPVPYLFLPVLDDLEGVLGGPQLPRQGLHRVLGHHLLLLARGGVVLALAPQLVDLVGLAPPHRLQLLNLLGQLLDVLPLL